MHSKLRNALFKWFDDNHINTNIDKIQLLLKAEAALVANVTRDVISTTVDKIFETALVFM